MTDMHRWKESILVSQMINAATTHVQMLPIARDSPNPWTGITETREGSRRPSWKSEADEDVGSGHWLSPGTSIIVHHITVTEIINSPLCGTIVPGWTHTHTHTFTSLTTFVCALGATACLHSRWEPVYWAGVWLEALPSHLYVKRIFTVMYMGGFLLLWKRACWACRLCFPLSLNGQSGKLQILLSYLRTG